MSDSAALSRSNLHAHLSAINEACLRGGLDLCLNPPAAATSLAALQTTIGEVPQGLLDLLGFADGQSAEFEFSWLPQGARLFSAAEITEVWQRQREWGDDDDSVEVWLQDQDRVRSTLRAPTRIKFWGEELYEVDEVGGYLDGIPGPAGTRWQVIVPVSECEFEVMAPTLEAFFARYRALLESGVASVQEGNYGERVLPTEPQDPYDNIMRLFRITLTW